MPLTLHYLGTERFGMWMTMSSLVAFLSFADLGMGNGLLSSVATAHGRDDRAKIRQLVSSAYFALGLIAIFVLAFLAVAYTFVPWHRVFNVQSDLARAEAGPAIAAMVACFALAIPIGVVQRTQLGLQMGYAASLWQCVASLLGLAGVMLAVWQEAPLPLLVLAYVGAPLLVGMANSLVFFLYQQRDLAPSPDEVSRGAIRSLVGTGLLFLILQIVSALTFSADALIIAHFFGAAAVATYAIPEKIFALISLMIGWAVSPMWPAYSEARARGDTQWVTSSFRRALVFSFWIAAASAFAAVLMMPYILHVWLGKALEVPLLLLVGFGVWETCKVWGANTYAYLNGMDRVGFQVFLAVALLVTALPLKFHLAGTIGIAGPLLATVVAYAVCVMIPFYLFFPKLLLSPQ